MKNAEKYAREHALVAQKQYADYYNARAKDKAFSVGDQVVVLEKDSAHKTFARWKHGTVVKVRSPYSYDIQMPDGACRQLDANKLRSFVARVQHVGIINDQDAEFGAVEYSPVAVNTQAVSLPSCRVDMNTLQHLDSVQCQQ